MANLRLPGPTPVPEDVFEAMHKQMIDHRGVEFADLIKRVGDNLKRAFETTNDVFVLTSSGTGAMEAAIVNTLSPGQRVLAITVGNFLSILPLHQGGCSRCGQGSGTAAGQNTQGTV